MAYSDFTFAKLYLKFGLEQETTYLFKDITIEPVAPSAHLLQSLEDAKDMPLYAEKAKSEAIIYPIIIELRRKNPHLSIFSGYTFNVDSANDLTGAPDFIISAKPRTLEPQCPIFCLVESKNKTPEEGFAQCAAEMYAARVFNEQMKEPYQTIYGVVTNAFDWIFMKLENNTIYADIDRFYLQDVSKLLGIFQHIINQYKK